MELNVIRQIEEAGMNAWPAHQQILYDGWLLRFADGYTKRANSVMPIYQSTLDINEKIIYCEDVYRQKDLPPVFRLTPLAQENLDLALEMCGYKKFHPTRVMISSLVDSKFTVSQKDRTRELPLEQWMGVFSEINGSMVEKQPAHAQILRNILSPHFTAALEISGKWVACGLGVLERDWMGLFDIVTHPDYRQQGFATQLISRILEWAKSQGATKSYLQVMENNAPALKLYTKLDYVDAYGYWYRVPPDY
jgi:GNAT superfamily N-acetyltransferase